MKLVKFTLSPDQASYSVVDGTEVIGSKLDGGASRYSREILNSNLRVTVKWIEMPDEYRYIRAF